MEKSPPDISSEIIEILFFRFPNHFSEHFEIPCPPAGYVLAEFEKVDGVHPGYLPGVEGPEVQEGLTAHISRQPVPVVVKWGRWCMKF